MPVPNGRKPSYGQVREPKRQPSWLSIDDLVRSNAIDWEEVVPEALTSAIRDVTARGALLIFGQTGDGGAVKLGVWDGELRKWWYPSSAEELTSLLRQIAKAAASDLESRSTQ